MSTSARDTATLKTSWTPIKFPRKCRLSFPIAHVSPKDRKLSKIHSDRYAGFDVSQAYPSFLHDRFKEADH